MLKTAHVACWRQGALLAVLLVACSNAVSSEEHSTLHAGPVGFKDCGLALRRGRRASMEDRAVCWTGRMACHTAAVNPSNAGEPASLHDSFDGAFPAPLLPETPGAQIMGDAAGFSSSSASALTDTPHRAQRGKHTSDNAGLYLSEAPHPLSSQALGHQQQSKKHTADVILAAVYDGHGGQRASQHLAEHLHGRILSQLAQALAGGCDPSRQQLEDIVRAAILQEVSEKPSQLFFIVFV